MNQFANKENNEISIGYLFQLLWENKFKIVGITLIFTTITIIHVLIQPNIYRSQAMLVSANEGQKSGLESLAAQYGGIAAIAGVDIGGGKSSRVEQAVELIKSWPFAEVLINDNHLKAEIFAANGWNSETNKIEFKNIYDPISQTWKQDEEKSSEPSSFEVYKAYSDFLSISSNKKTGVVRISFDHYSPEFANKMVELVVTSINRYYQDLDMSEAKRNIAYLNQKISETSVTDMKSVFYKMIESQTKTIMLAEVSEEYLMRVVVPSKTAEVPVKPNRVLLTILGTIFGGTTAIFYVLIVNVLMRKK